MANNKQIRKKYLSHRIPSVEGARWVGSAAILTGSQFYIAVGGSLHIGHIVLRLASYKK